MEFNPFFRQSARELLKNAYFDDIRILKNEMHAPFKLKLDIDADGSFDYEKGNSKIFSKADYQQKIKKLIAECHEEQKLKLSKYQK